MISTSSPVIHILGAAALAWFISALGTPLLAWAARRWGIVDRPSGYKAHGRPVPLLGGLAIALGALGGTGWFMGVVPSSDFAALAALGLGTGMILAAGLLDDLRQLSPRYKFSWQVAAAGAAGLSLAAMGVRLDLFLQWPPLPLMLLTAAWIIGITNALNFLDNMNGLCAGLGAIAATALAVINLRSGEISTALAAASLAGACLGFLPYNWPAARIFLGDTGSMSIGFLLAALSVMGVYTDGDRATVLTILTPLFVLGVPVLDSLLVIVLRLRARHPPWVGDRRHISHRLVRRGMQPAHAVATLWAAGIACGLAGVLLPVVGSTEAPWLLALILSALAALAAAAGTRGLGED